MLHKCWALLLKPKVGYPGEASDVFCMDARDGRGVGGRLRARWTLVESQDRLSIDPRGLVLVVALDVVVVITDVAA